MELFIGNLTPNANLGELIAFFKGFSNKAKFRVEEKTLEDGVTIRYVVADFANDKYALKMMEKFAGQVYRGKELVIREYLHRTYTNERRAVNWRDKPWRAGERRHDDRRLKTYVAQQDDFEAILATSTQDKVQTLDEQADNLKVEAYRDLAKKS